MSVNGPSAGAVATTEPSPLSQPLSASFSSATASATQSSSATYPPDFTERHRLLAALRERAAETAVAVASTMPRSGCAANGLCAALVDEHSSLLRCLNLLEESGDEMNMVVSPLKISDETKTVKKRHKRKIKRHQGEASTQLAIMNEKCPSTIPRNRRKCKTPTNVPRLAKSKLQNSSQRELLPGQENAKQRTVKSNTKKKLSVDYNQKSSNLATKGQKLLGDKKKKIQKSGSAKKLKTAGVPPKNVPRTQSSLEIVIPEEKRQVKRRRMKLQRNSKESLELAFSPLDTMYQEINPRAEGEGPKRLPKKAKRTANKNCIIAVPAPNVHRKLEGRKVPITPRKGSSKRQPTKVKNKGSLKSKTFKGEYPPKQVEEKMDSNLKERNMNQPPNKDQPEEYSFDKRNVCPIAVAPILSTVKIASKTFFDAPSVNIPSVESKQSQNSVAPETRETCLRSILRDTNKKLVSIGSKTVRFFEDTLPPKKCKKRKTKCSTKKSVLIDKPMSRKFVRPNPNTTPPKETVIGFVRVVTPTKNVDSVKKKKRGKATIKEKKSFRSLLINPNENELLEDIKEDTVVEVTPLKQKKLYVQVNTTEGETDFPQARSEEVLDVSSAKDLPLNSPSKTSNITADSWRNSAKDSNFRPEKRKSLNKLLSIDDSHIPNSLVLRCQRRSLRDLTNRYSTLLADIHKAKDQTDPSEKISKTSIKSYASTSENLSKTKTTVTSYRRRSTDITRDLNIVNRNTCPKPAIFSLGSNNNPPKQIDDEKFMHLRTSQRKSLSQTSIKNSMRMINSDHYLTPANSRTQMSRLSLNFPISRRCQKMNLRYLGTRRDLGNSLSRSVSTSHTSTRCKLASRDSKVLYDIDKNNLLPPQDKKSFSSHNWLKRIRSEDPRFHYMDNNSPKWIDGGIAPINPPSHSIFVGRTTRKKSTGINKTKAPDSKIGHETTKIDDEIYFSENPTSDADSTISCKVNVGKDHYVHLAHIENNPAFTCCKNPKCSNKSEWKHTPLKYIFQVITGEPLECLTSKSNKNYNRSSKNQRHEGQRQKSAGASETEDDGSRTVNISERGDSSRKSRNRPVKTKKPKSSSCKTNFQKNISYASEIDEESVSSRKSPLSPTQHSRNKFEEKQVPPTCVVSGNKNNPSSRRINRRKLESFDLTRQ